MKKSVIRHTQSVANRMTRAAFGVEGAPLSPRGIVVARELGTQLRGEGIDLLSKVAVSKKLRTQQTAIEAGFQNLVINELIDEINTSYDPQELMLMLARNQLPEAALFAADRILENPPPEDIWVSHGLVIAGLCHRLGQTYQNIVPDFGEVRTLDI